MSKPTTSSQDIPYGYCQCGCGQKTTVSKRNSTIHGRVKGQPMRYISGHNLPKAQPVVPKLCGCGCGGVVKSRAGRFLPGHTRRLIPGRPIIERFWEKVARAAPNECWEWSGCRSPKNYGLMSVGSKTDGSRHTRFAHRISYELHYGPIPAGMSVCHKCDNPPCVNPAHLFLGSHQVNMHDMTQKGRATKGNKNPQARLTADQVRAIRAQAEDGDTHAEIAARFSINRSTVSMIVNRKRWGHIE